MQTEALEEGVETHGEGKWADIQQGSSALKNRSQVCVCVRCV